MGKKADYPTPEQRALEKRVAESESLRTIAAALHKAEIDAAEMAEDRKSIARALAIRDGLIRPPWMDESQPATKPKTPRRSQKRERFWKALREKYPPDGNVGHDTTPEVRRKLKPVYIKNGWGDGNIPSLTSSIANLAAESTRSTFSRI